MKKTKININLYFKCSKLFLQPYAFIIVIIILSTLKPSLAQIIPDSSLGSESSKVSTELENSFVDKIEGGATRGGNLFHSFEQFSIPTGGTAYFNNAVDVQNIFSRVTGKNISNIDGLIRANGNANLFLLNPNGIVFGPNARLDIGGSFLGSTSDSINFADGIRFSSTEPQSTPLLTVSVPVGLGFTSSPQSIRVEGNGHSLLGNVGTLGNPVIGSGQSTTGLRTSPDQAIILVGGDVKIEGGILTAPSGQIEIGSVDSGLVKIESANNEGWIINYDSVQGFRDIKLEKLALLDTSGFKNGNIFLRGKDITITDPSLVIVSNFGNLDSGKVSVNASGNIEIVGIRKPNPIAQYIAPARGIITQNLSIGKAANIEVLADNIFIRDSGGITSTSFASGAGGNVSLASRGTIELYGTKLPTTGLLAGGITTTSFSTGNAGNLKISAKNLSIRDGSFVSSTALGSADGGNLQIDVTNNIDVLGGALITFDPNFINNSFWPSFVGATTTSSGKAGDVLINTENLSITGGARIDSSTLASGSSGSLIVNAIDSITVNGKAANLPNPSLIISSANISDPFFKLFYNLPTTLEGKSGSITLNTDRLSVLNGAQISARNDGTGDGGSIQINASSINLDAEGRITAAASSEGGNIFLRSQNLQLHNGSNITATAGGTGNAGNIYIDTDLLTVLENSKITADAFQGQGGNIQINTQGLFRSLGSLIRADSDLGIDGTVEIISPFLDFTKAVAQPEAKPQNPEVALFCQEGSDKVVSSLINAGTGGIPASPTDPLNSTSGWYDNSIADQRIKDSQATTLTNTKTEPFVEAQGWKWNADGTLSMTLEPEEVVPYGSLTTPPCQELSHNQEVKN